MARAISSQKFSSRAELRAKFLRATSSQKCGSSGSSNAQASFFSSKFRASSLLTTFKIGKYDHIPNPAHLLSSFEHTQTNLEVKLLNKSSNSQKFGKKRSNIYYFLARLHGSSHFEPKRACSTMGGPCQNLERNFYINLLM